MYTCMSVRMCVCHGVRVYTCASMHPLRTNESCHTRMRAKCTVLVIQQMPTNCVQTNDNNPVVLPHIILYLSTRRHLATGMIPAIAIISRLLCIQGTRGSFIYFTKNSLLSLGRNMKSAVHVPYAG